MIGLYKKQLDVKNYKGEKRLTRESYKNSDSFFKNRTKRLDSDKYGFVELHFMINKVLFIVKRSLYEAKIIEANVIKNGFSTTIEGLPINQDSYKDYNDAEKNKNNLQFNYETLILFVVATDRNGNKRIISARKAEPDEEVEYYENYDAR